MSIAKSNVPSDDYRFADSGGPHALANRPEARNFVAEGRHAIRRRWLATMLAGCVAGGLAGVIVWITVPRQYNALAVLRVSMAPANILDQTKVSESSNSFEIYKRTQRQLLRSPAVLSAALQRESVAQLPLVAQQADAVDWLQNNVTVSFPDESEIMYVSVRCEDQQTAEALANAIVKVYMETSVYAERQEKLNGISSLQNAEAETEAILRTKRSELRRLADTLGTGDSEALTMAQKNTFEQYTALWKQLNQVEFELKRARPKPKTASKDEPVEPQIAITVTEEEVDSAAMIDPRIIAGRVQVDRLEKQVHDAPKTMYGAVLERHVAEKHADISREQARIKEQKAALKADLLVRKRSAVLASEQSRFLSVEILESLQRDLSKQVADLRKEADKFGRSSVDVELMRAEIKALDDLRDHLQRALHSANIEIANVKSRVALLSSAATRQNDDRNRRIRLSAAGTVFGVLLGSAAVIFWDTRRRRLNSVQEVVEMLRLPLLGSIPYVPRANRNDDSAEGILEAIDGIVARLVLSPADDQRQVILVTSAQAGEGKTTVAANVAGALAGMGRRTLLIDFDLRRPTLHKMFNVDLAPGLAGIFANEVEPLDAVSASSAENLFILPAGAWNGRGLSAGNDEQIRRLLRDVRGAFVHIVVDTGPVLPIVDTRIISRHVDDVMICLLRDVSEIPKAEAACELLRSFNVRISGAVMIGTPNERYYSRFVATTTKSVEAIGDQPTSHALTQSEAD